jgi:photosystem II stability/assembly factor-like uncharacterized protein
MPGVSGDEIIKTTHKRNFIQFGGARPNNPMAYAGQNAQYMAITGVGNPELGGVDPIRVQDPRRPGRYRIVGRSLSPADLASATLTLKERRGSMPKQLSKINCAFNAYEVTGACKDLSDFMGGWTDYTLIYSGALVTDKNLGDRSPFDTDDPIEDELSLVLNDIYPVGALSFGDNAAPQVDREVMDVVYGSVIQCGDCGVPDDGTQRIYGITRPSGAASPGLPAEVIYSLDGGATWNEATITGIAINEVALALDVVGDKLVIVSRDAGPAGGYYWAQLSTLGVPGSFTKVTTGFVAGKYPNDLYVASPREVYFCGDGGYIYKTTDITVGVTAINAGSATTDHLIRINGQDETIVAVGASMAIVKSVNRGVTWAITGTAPVAASSASAVAVLGQLRYWVGTLSGRIFYTINGGDSWVEKTFNGSGSGVVRDIVFATDDVGYFSHDTTTPTARIFATWNGGADWTNLAPRILNLPTFNRATRIAAPRDVDNGVAANNLAVGGLSGGGTDGTLLLGVAAVL